LVLCSRPSCASPGKGIRICWMKRKRRPQAAMRKQEGLGTPRRIISQEPSQYLRPSPNSGFLCAAAFFLTSRTANVSSKKGVAAMVRASQKRIFYALSIPQTQGRSAKLHSSRSPSGHSKRSFEKRRWLFAELIAAKKIDGATARPSYAPFGAARRDLTQGRVLLSLNRHARSALLVERPSVSNHLSACEAELNYRLHHRQITKSLAG
jgi:hypothetical protein